MYFFADDYRDGRAKFHAVCRTAGLEIDSFINPNAVAPNGDELAMDIVWCGNASATRVLLVTCGTHGLEAAPGSATILQWLSGGVHRDLPDDTALMIVHGVNAYGWAHASRTNEDNIDVNRNFLNHNEPKPHNSAYEDLHQQILLADISDGALAASIQNFHAYGEKNGANNAIHGITGGQYRRADGIGYGGDAESWSCSTLIHQVRNRLTHARKVIAIDWHTGIGDFGKPFFILKEAKDSDSFRRAAEWWGEEHIHSDDIFADSGSPDYSGLLLDGLKQEIQAINGAEVVSTGVEWGTYGLDSMLQALMIDRWLRFADTDPGSTKSLQLRTRLIERFYPSMPEWRNAVLVQSERIYHGSLVGLRDWL